MGGRGCRTMGGGGRAGVGTEILQLSLELHTMIQDWSTYWEASFSMRSISASMSGGRSSSHATSISRAHALAQNETKLRMHNFVCIRSGQGGHWYRKPLWAAFRNGWICKHTKVRRRRDAENFENSIHFCQELSDSPKKGPPQEEHAATENVILSKPPTWRQLPTPMRSHLPLRCRAR